MSGGICPPLLVCESAPEWYSLLVHPGLYVGLPLSGTICLYTRVPEAGGQTNAELALNKL